jgi:putative DNA methylase
MGRPIIESKGSNVPKIQFEVRTGKGKVHPPTKTGRGATFKCLSCKQPVEEKHTKTEAISGRLDARLMAIVAESSKGRIYLSPNSYHEKIADSGNPTWKPDAEICKNARWFSPPLYGLETYGEIFTKRQLIALETFSQHFGQI